MLKKKQQNWVAFFFKGNRRNERKRGRHKMGLEKKESICVCVCICLLFIFENNNISVDNSVTFLILLLKPNQVKFHSFAKKQKIFDNIFRFFD